MNEEVKRVMSDVFGVPVGEIADDATPDAIEAWDSVSHLNLVMALEEEFGVKFTDEQIVEFSSCREIAEAVEARTRR